MGKMSKKIKKGKVSTSPLDPKLMVAWNQGFNAGVKQQREADIEHLVKLLSNLEEVSGIGEKTATKIREHILSKFD